MNIVRKAVTWIVQKAIGFPPWNLSSQPGSTYHDFFRSMSGYDALHRLPTVYTCCNLLGRRIATLPIDIVESDGNISRPVDNYISGLLQAPNEFMNKVAFMEALLLNFNLRGNAFAEIVRIGNRITALWPIASDRVKINWANGKLNYDVSLPDGSIARLEPSQVLHVKNFSLDGVNGLSPLQLHAVRKNIGAEEFQANFLKNGARPSIAFVSPEKPSPEAQDRVRQTGERLYSGPENAGRILFLWGGMDVKTISVSPEDAQLMQTLQMGVAEISAAYGVPLNLLNQTDKTATYASAEQFNRYFVDYTLDPLCVRVAAALTEALINPRLNAAVKFNLDALLAGNPESRMNYLKAGVAGGLITPNEARAKLNLPPMSGGDELVIQSNMTLLDALEQLAQRQAQPQPRLIEGQTPKSKYLPSWS